MAGDSEAPISAIRLADVWLLVGGPTDRRDATFGFLFDGRPKTIQVQDASVVCLSFSFSSLKSTFIGAVFTVYFGPKSSPSLTKQISQTLHSSFITTQHGSGVTHKTPSNCGHLALFPRKPFGLDFTQVISLLLPPLTRYFWILLPNINLEFETGFVSVSPDRCRLGASSGAAS